MFRHADVACLCLVCVLWQFSMVHSAMGVSFCLPHPVALT